MNDDDNATIEAMRRYGWVRDEGGWDRLRGTRPALARNDDERCTYFHERKCAYTKGHPGLHVEEWREGMR